MNFEHVQSSDATSCDHSRIVQSLATDAINRKTVSNRSYDSKQSVVRQLKKNAAAGRKPTVRSLWKPLKKFVSGTATDKRWKAQGRGCCRIICGAWIFIFINCNFHKLSLVCACYLKMPSPLHPIRLRLVYVTCHNCSEYVTESSSVYSIFFSIFVIKTLSTRAGSKNK